MLERGAALLYLTAAIQGLSLKSITDSGVNVTTSLAEASQAFAAAAGATAAALGATASLEEKQIDWQDQLTQAQDDQVIANQQYTMRRINNRSPLRSKQLLTCSRGMLRRWWTS